MQTVVAHGKGVVTVALDEMREEGNVRSRLLHSVCEVELKNTGPGQAVLATGIRKA